MEFYNIEANEELYYAWVDMNERTSVALGDLGGVVQNSFEMVHNRAEAWLTEALHRANAITEGDEVRDYYLNLVGHTWKHMTGETLKGDLGSVNTKTDANFDMKIPEFDLTFGQVVDNLKEGQISENSNGIYIVKRAGKLYSGFDVNNAIVVSTEYTDTNWRITDFFEKRKCPCCGDLKGVESKGYDKAEPSVECHKEYLENRERMLEEYRKAGIRKFQAGQSSKALE